MIPIISTIIMQTTTAVMEMGKVIIDVEEVDRNVEDHEEVAAAVVEEEVVVVEEEAAVAAAEIAMLDASTTVVHRFVEAEEDRWEEGNLILLLSLPNYNLIIPILGDTMIEAWEEEEEEEEDLKGAILADLPVE